jgi:GWxTD domain-containing protein
MRPLEGGLVKKFLLAAAALAIASVALCQVSKYKDWPKSPEAYFLTPAEKQEWSKVATDAEAEKFIADYWATRGGGRFKDAIERRIAAADQQFKLRRQKGSESVRGRVFIVLGNPTRVSEARENAPSVPDGSGPTGSTGNFDSESGPTAVVQTWIYAKDKFDPSWDVGEFQARISVDPQRGTDELQNAGPVNKAIEKVAARSIVAPGAGAAGVAAVKPAVPPSATGPGPAPAAAAAVAPAPVAAALPAAPRAVLEPLLEETAAKPGGGFWGGEFRTVAGDPFYAFQIIDFGKKDAPAPAGMKLGGVVTREDGQEATSFWEDAAPVDMKGREGIDKVVDHSISLPAGSYRGAFGLFSADGGAALASASTVFTIHEKSTEFTVSPLILAAVLTPLTKRPNPTDAFVFGMEKPIRVEPQGNGLFKREDGLWYFFTVANPVVPAEAAPASPTPADAAVAAAPAPDAAARTAPKPRIMTRLGVLRDGKPAFQPATIPAELQPLAPNLYANGSEIPLASFEPGYYTFTLNVRDLNAPRDSAAFKGIDRTGDFVVLMPDGALPPVPTPAAAKPTPKPKPKKS